MRTIGPAASAGERGGAAPGDRGGTTPDVVGDILREAWRPDVPAPVSLHVRPEVHARMLAQGSPRTDEVGADVPVVVDDEIPAQPGYEIHRAPPPGAAA
ncbi:hypothetical protein OF117_09540 [Geodermatophilus sp. YIM 151500]|uniref:hypothetical protein n=1 Tax=Geodermatophilus sp. YIM 151500 TaxID=2984531 RepID=UPI0021E44C31|nr:hypothetical protein [Geodermatophilus sp. YIM 151500]MCV2489608.1 hypothetical protein [Geodermatophilus sp. YIM 151500]